MPHTSRRTLSLSISSRASISSARCSKTLTRECFRSFSGHSSRSGMHLRPRHRLLSSQEGMRWSRCRLHALILLQTAENLRAGCLSMLTSRWDVMTHARAEAARSSRTATERDYSPHPMAGLAKNPILKSNEN